MVISHNSKFTSVAIPNCNVVFYNDTWKLELRTIDTNNTKLHTTQSDLLLYEHFFLQCHVHEHQTCVCFLLHSTFILTCNYVMPHQSIYPWHHVTCVTLITLQKLFCSFTVIYHEDLTFQKHILVFG